jgi:hypothetical protein
VLLTITICLFIILLEYRRSLSRLVAATGRLLRGADRQSLVGQREVGLGAAHHVVARLLPHGAAAVARGCRPGRGGCSGRAVGGGDDLDAFGSGSGAGDGRAGFQPGVLVVGNEPKSKYSVSN